MSLLGVTFQQYWWCHLCGGFGDVFTMAKRCRREETRSHITSDSAQECFTAVWTQMETAIAPLSGVKLVSRERSMKNMYQVR
jgi:hypothetical protein